ncbi:MAG: type II toxin-antitoxin system RelE/ParE family toxin [Bacteroidetes bacterium]|nr:type II toxin-antitoxin system RelE/ParE family toxin [Bacteroidota bacterium]
MVRINWTIQAKDDLNNIAEYISKDSKRYAKLQVIKLRNRTQILKTQLHSGKIVPEINIENIRELIEGRYRIIYKVVDKNQVDILTIHHTARDLKKRKIK